MQDAVSNILSIIVQHRRPNSDSLAQPTSIEEARAFVTNVDAVLRPRPVLCSWFADACVENATHLTDHIRFLAVAVVLSCVADLPLCILNAVKMLLPQCDPPSRDLLSLLHWKCIISVAGVTCLQQSTHPMLSLNALCEHASDCALAASVSETINTAAVVHRNLSSTLRPPSAAVFDWARALIVQSEDRAQLFAWLLRYNLSDINCWAAHDAVAACPPLTERGQISSRISISSPLLLLQEGSASEVERASVKVHDDIMGALCNGLHSLSAVAMSHRTSCTIQQFLETLCECLNAEVQTHQTLDISSCLPSIFDLVDLVHDKFSLECPSITLPLARTLATRCRSAFGVWMCVHKCMLGPAASGCMEVTAADVGVALVPPAPLARLTHISGPVDAGVHACWAFACACMQQQLHADLDLLPSTLICLARTCDAAAVAAALLCRAGQWLCMCNMLQFEDSSKTSEDEALSRCIDVVMMTLQDLTSLASLPSMTFLSHVHDAWRSAVADACEHDDAVLDCVPPYLSLFSLAASTAVFTNVYGPNITTDVTALIISALNLVPRLRQLLLGWMKRCRLGSTHSLFVALRDAGVVSSSVLQAESLCLHDDSANLSSGVIDNLCPQTPPRADRFGTFPLAYRLAQYPSPSQKSPSTASPLHKSTVAMLDRVLQRFSDDPLTLPVDAAKFSQQVKSLDSWRHMVAAVAAPLSSTWAATNLKIRCRFVHALVSSSLPGADAALPHLAAWIVAADRRMDGDVLHSIVTTWARSSMLLDCNAFCLWALRQAQGLPGVLSSFQSLHKATTILQPMLNAPSMMSAMSAELISKTVSVSAAGRMLALVFASGYPLDALLLHRSAFSFGFFDEVHKLVGGDSAAAALRDDSFNYLCMHGVAGAALIFLHEDDAIESLLRTCSSETLRIMTHRICFHVLRCLSFSPQSLNRCNIRVLLSLASTMTRDLPLDAELPENAAAAERLFKMCSVLQPSQIQQGQEAIQLLRYSRCDLVRTSIENLCSSFFSDACAVACAQQMMSCAWDASWLASMIAACGHEWDLAGAERALSLLGLQLQLGSAPDVGICASLPASMMLQSAVLLMQQRQRYNSVEHIASIALQLFCRKASVTASACYTSSKDGLNIAASLASLCAVFCENSCVEQLSLLLCMFTSSLMQLLEFEKLKPCDAVTEFFDANNNASCWRGLCYASSRRNLALAAAAGFSSGAVLLAQLLRVGASFAAALPLLQAAPSYSFAAFSPQMEDNQRGIHSSVKFEQHQDEDIKASSIASMLHPFPHLPAAASATAESNRIDHSASSCSSQTKRQLNMHGSQDCSSPLAGGLEDFVRQDAESTCEDNAPVFTSLLPKKRQELPLSSGAKHQQPDHALQNSPASSDTGLSKPLSWLAQLRANKANSEYKIDDFSRHQGMKCEPVQSASPAVLRIASASSDRLLLQAKKTGVGAETLSTVNSDQSVHHSTAEGGSDDDIVALS